MLRVEDLALPEAFKPNLPKYTLTANVDLALLSPQHETVDCQLAARRVRFLKDVILG